MSKRLRHDMRYDGATPEQVYAMLATPGFREAVCEYQRYPERTVEITPAGQGMRVRVDQYRPADEVPSFAKKLVGARINILQEETWHSPASADLSVTIPGKPGEMFGTIKVVGDDAGVTETVDVQVKANIPLLGGKLEDFIAGMLLRALKAENRVGVKWLAEH
jgi:hypothetical protein